LGFKRGADSNALLSHHRPPRVTAEGVETQQQLDMLGLLGRPMVQGYLSAAAFTE
jgi:EAL domain-containing protein (putative c-di-GMP-specific phosphodiesterase class I)